MSTSNQQTLADSEANERPPMHEKGNYIPWESRPIIPNPDNTIEQILKPMSKMNEGNKKQYIADVKVMNYLLQAIPNDIYNSMDASSKAKKAAKNHDPLALLAHLNVSSSQYHANSSYSPQPYYVTYPSSIADYENEYQGELQGDSQEDKLTTAMMLLARSITQKFSTPTNNHLRTSSNTRNQAVIQDGRVDIQTKNAGYGRNGNRNAGRQNRNQAFNAGTGNDESNQIVQHVSSTKSNPGKKNVQSMKDEAGSNLKDEENDFMLNNSYGDDTLEELTAVVIMMARIQSADDNSASEPSYDVKAVSEVNASIRVHEHVNRVKCKTIIHTSNNDQIDSNIIFDNPYVENNGGTSEHDSTTLGEYHDIIMLAYN
ncbi:hypothetical protein Tco_0862815 [Tanacetum coccineum]